jgi:hypothetical protein
MAKIPFYKRTKPGALSTEERNLTEAIESLCQKNNVSADSLKIARTVEDLEELKKSLETTAGKPSSSESSSEEVSETAPDQNFDVDLETEKALEKKPSVEKTHQEPIPSSKPDISSTFEMSDFVPQENSNPFTSQFKTEGRDYTKGEVNVGGDQKIDVNNTEAGSKTQRTPTVDEVPEIGTTAPANDSTPAPWAVNTDNEIEVNNREKGLQDDINSDDPEKVKLAESTKKKATKHISKQAANLYAIIVEKTGRYAGEIPEKRLDKLEREGKLDRQFIIDEKSGETVEKFVDDHNKRLKDLVKLEDDVKEDFQEALELVMEKHQFEVTPEVNLAIVTISGFATTIQQARQCRNESMKVLEKAERTYKLVNEQLAQSYDRNRELEQQLLELKVQMKERESGSPARVVNLPVNQGEPAIKSGTFSKPNTDEVSHGEKTITESENLIETITSQIEGENVSFSKKREVKQAK